MNKSVIDYVAKIKTSCKIEGLNQPISTQAVENMNKNGQLRVCCIVKKNWSASWIEIYTDLETMIQINQQRLINIYGYGSGYMQIVDIQQQRQVAGSLFSELREKNSDAHNLSSSK